MRGRLKLLFFYLLALKSISPCFGQKREDTIRQTSIEARDYFQHFIGYLYLGVGVTPYTSNYSVINYFHNDFRGNYDITGELEIKEDPFAYGVNLAVGPFGEKNFSFYPVGFSFHKTGPFRKNAVSSGMALTLPFTSKKNSNEYPRFWMELGFDLSYHFYKMVVHEQRVSKGDPVLQSFDPYFHEDSILKTNGFYQLSGFYGHLSIEPMISLNYRVSNFISLRFQAKSIYNLYEETFRLKMDYKPRWGIESEMEVGDFFIRPTPENFSAEGEVVDNYPLKMIPYSFNLGLVFRLKSDLGRAGKAFPRYRPN